MDTETNLYRRDDYVNSILDQCTQSHSFGLLITEVFSFYLLNLCLFIYVSLFQYPSAPSPTSPRRCPFLRFLTSVGGRWPSSVPRTGPRKATSCRDDCEPKVRRVEVLMFRYVKTTELGGSKTITIPLGSSDSWVDPVHCLLSRF